MAGLDRQAGSAPWCSRTLLALRIVAFLGGPVLAGWVLPAEAASLHDVVDCSGAPVVTAGEARRDVRVITPSAVPHARAILDAAQADEGARMSFEVDHPEPLGPAAVDIQIDGLRDLAFPRSLTNDLVYDDLRRTQVVDDRRSSLSPLWRVDEATVVASDLAYEVAEHRLPDLHEAGDAPPAAATDLPDYDVVATYLDTYTGFKAIAFERRDPAPGEAHRIYAIAGTQVFVNTDFRDWAAGLTMARAHMVSTAALRLIADAAAYAEDREHGGEVLITGQSQGAVTAQGVGFMLQEFLDAQPAPSHHLVHVVSWGAVGAREPIGTMIRRERAGQGRDFPQSLERHWAATDPDEVKAMAVWRQVSGRWVNLSDASIAAHIDTVVAEMRIVGYFFEIDPFARAGTFLGTSLVFPTAFVLPADCEQLVTELMFQTRAGKLGITLESHFLKGYQRAVARGALAVARPAEPRKWDWVVDLLPTGDVIGKFWLNEIYRDKVLSTDTNWRNCRTAGQWRTERNRSCRRGYWPGCSNEGLSAGGEAGAPAETARWCVVDEPPPADGAVATAAARPEG
ncbi:MAG: hypothetical protein JNM75_04755 [Rhodospirillales bacterium]|nr:hypothetical protein [Rhodospirillales bacterium]